MTIKFNWFGDKVKKQNKAAAAEVLEAMAEGVLTEANKTVPHDEGTLERSGTTKVDEKKLIAAIGYDTPYAARLHESEPGEVLFRGRGRRKWLEQTVSEMSSRLEKFAAEEYKKRL